MSSAVTGDSQGTSGGGEVTSICRVLEGRRAGILSNEVRVLHPSIYSSAVEDALRSGCPDPTFPPLSAHSFSRPLLWFSSLVSGNLLSDLGRSGRRQVAPNEDVAPDEPGPLDARRGFYFFFCGRARDESVVMKRVQNRILMLSPPPAPLSPRSHGRAP